MKTYYPALTSIAPGKALGVFAQSEAGATTKLYSVLGDIGAGTWTTPVQITGFTGNVVGTDAPQASSVHVNTVAVLGNPAKGVATAAWTSKVAGEVTARVWLSTYTYSTSTWSTPQQVGTAGANDGVQLVASPSGAVLLGWLTPSSALAGATALNTYLIPTVGAPQTSSLELGASRWAIALGVSDNTTIAAAWMGASLNMVLARKTAAGWSTPIAVGPGGGSMSDMSLLVNADSSSLLAFTGSDTSLHIVALDATGNQTSSQLMTPSAFGNARPSLAALGGGKYVLVFAGSAFKSNTFYDYHPYGSVFTPGVGWSAPVVMHDVLAAGYVQIQVDTAGNALAVVLGSNLDSYVLPTGSKTWTQSSWIAYTKPAPGFAMDKSTGRAALLWSKGNQLESAFFK